MKIIKSIEDLKNQACQSEGFECSIILNGGISSRKHIYFENKKFYITNYIDDSDQILTEKQLMNRNFTNIGYALSLGSLAY